MPEMTVGTVGYLDGRQVRVEKIREDGRINCVSTDSTMRYLGWSPEQLRFDWPVVEPVGAPNHVLLPPVEGTPPTDRTVELEPGAGVRAFLSSLVPLDVDARFITHLRDTVARIRVHYQAKVEASVRDWFAENDLTLPSDISPVKSAMRGVAGTLTFARPVDMTILPEGMRVIERGRRLEINSIRLVVSLLKKGFHINSYVRAKPVLAEAA